MLPKCVEAASRETTFSQAGVTAAAVFGVIIFCIAIGWIGWVYYKRSVASRRKRKLVHYIRLLGNAYGTMTRHKRPSKGGSEQDRIRALDIARQTVLRDVLVYSPHLGETLTRHGSDTAHFSMARFNDGELPEGWVTELNGAIFLALLVDEQELIPFLVAEGANACMKHPDTGKLAVSQMLSNSVVPTVNFRVLHTLFRAEKLDIDDALGQMLRRRSHYIRMIRSDGSPVVVDAAEHAQYLKQPTRATDDSGFDDRSSSDAGALEYASREAEGYVTVNMAMTMCLKEMARNGWRSTDDRRDTVIHRVLVACQLGRIDEDVGMDLIDAVLAIDPSVSSIFWILSARMHVQ
jgi:hypothetical protein